MSNEMAQMDLFGTETAIAAPTRPAPRKAPKPEQFALFAIDEAVREADKPADERFAGVIARDLTADGLLFA